MLVGDSEAMTAKGYRNILSGLKKLITLEMRNATLNILALLRIMICRYAGTH